MIGWGSATLTVSQTGQIAILLVPSWVFYYLFSKMSRFNVHLVKMSIIDLLGHGISSVN